MDRPDMSRRRYRFLRGIPQGKKAQEQEAQLNWVFVLVVGALILAFFGFIVIKQKAASDAKFSGKVSQQLNTLLVGAKVSSGTVQEIDTPDLSIRFSCNDYYLGPASQRLGNRVVFAPEFLEGNKLITWALDWSAPFKVSTFLYMTTPYTQYIVVDDDRSQNFFNSLPDKLNKKAATYEQFIQDTVVSEDDTAVRFIFMNPDEGGYSPASHELPPTFDPTTVSGVNVYTKNPPRRVEFMKPEGNDLVTFGSAIEYTEDELLYGAIFSDNPEIYDCLAQRAYARLNVVAEVHAARLRRMYESFKYTNCEGFYKNNANIAGLITATAAYPPQYGEISSIKSALESDNTRLQLYSCPLIY